MANYRFEDETEKFISLRKKGNVNLSNVQLTRLALSHPITNEKKNDVDKLLKKLYGDNKLGWRGLRSPGLVQNCSF